MNNETVSAILVTQPDGSTNISISQQHELEEDETLSHPCYMICVLSALAIAFGLAGYNILSQCL